MISLLISWIAAGYHSIKTLKNLLKPTVCLVIPFTGEADRWVLEVQYLIFTVKYRGYLLWYLV